MTQALVRIRHIAGAAASIGLLALGLGSASAQDKVLNVYNWSDYIDEAVVKDFETKTGIKVNYSVYDSNETLDGRLSAGNSGFDIVVPTSNFADKQIKQKIYQPLDKSKIPNLSGLDAKIMEQVAVSDPGNAHLVPYLWGTNGLGLNKPMITKLLPNAPLDSWDLIFKPEVTIKIQKCGLSMLDSPSEILPLALKYLGKDPFSEKDEDLDAALQMLLKIRPHLKYIHSSKYIDDLAKGNLCLAMGWSGDMIQARSRAEAAAAAGRRKLEISYVIPQPFSMMWFDLMAIPATAKNVANAHAFINFVIDPANMAKITNFVGYPNAVTATKAMVKPELVNDPSVYPTPEVIARLFANKAGTAEGDKKKARLWARFRSGR